MSDKLVLIEKDGAVGVVRLNRPKKLNALSLEMLHELAEGLDQLDADEAVRAIVLTGNARVFAAGADIEAMAELSAEEMRERDTRQYWLRMWAIKKPVIAAVSGWALGGGCELALQCDLIVASESAKFGQPEIKPDFFPCVDIGTAPDLRQVGHDRGRDAKEEERDFFDAQLHGLGEEVAARAALKSTEWP
ncbi:MAG: enoyl-CoA hydratase/isomerase family protein [Chloroflexi bacterium]|nr:enoyl-CoA hydratase/isomerase family protein [Chloroflexota bacterium]